MCLHIPTQKQGKPCFLSIQNLAQNSWPLPMPPLYTVQLVEKFSFSVRPFPSPVSASVQVLKQVQTRFLDQ
ncbi:hypothetical protein EVA_15065 [gut metagenome]|uniref:Uncharacterized protein n=1 Tax=gut metagenome TaxID=749906 RepID=J9GBN5_9ZZZZ